MKWVILCFGVLIGYFLLRFGMVSRGRLRQHIQFAGGCILTIMLILSFIFMGILKGLISILIFWFIITPIVEIIIRRIDKKINAPYEAAHRYFAEKYNTTPDEVKKKIYEHLDNQDSRGSKT